MLANPIEVVIFPDTEGVGVTVGYVLGEDVTVGDALATDELVVVATAVVVFAAAVVVALLVSELDA